MRFPLRSMAMGAAVLLLLAACASGTSRVQAYADPALRGSMTQILLLLPASLFPNAGDYAEQQVVAAMRGRGVAVRTRDEFFRASERPSREAIVATLARSDIDGVLVLDVIGGEQGERGRPDLSGVRGNIGEFETEVSRLLATRGSVGSSYRETQTEVLLRLRLYHRESERLAAETVLQVSNPGSPFDLVDRVGPRIAAEVVRTGMIAVD